MVNSKKALESAKIIAEYCEQQRSCQNCIFRLHASDNWECNIKAFYLQDVLSNIEAKKKHNGYI